MIGSLESDYPSVVQEVHPHGGGDLRESGHQGQRAADRDDESRSRGQLDLPDVQDPSPRGTLLLGVVGEGRLSLRDAHGQVPEAVGLDLGDGLLRGGSVGDGPGAVDVGGDRLDLVLDGCLVGVQELEVGLVVLQGLEDRVGEVDRTLSALDEGVRERPCWRGRSHPLRP